jgi:hypothetical protein
VGEGAGCPNGSAATRPLPVGAAGRHSDQPQRVASISISSGSRATLKAACSPTAWRDSLPTGGFFNCDAKPAVLSDTVLDDKTAAWLWDWSARQVKLPADWDLPARRGAS